MTNQTLSFLVNFGIVIASAFIMMHLILYLGRKDSGKDRDVEDNGNESREQCQCCKEWTSHSNMKGHYWVDNVTHSNGTRDVSVIDLCCPVENKKSRWTFGPFGMMLYIDEIHPMTEADKEVACT